MTTALITGNTYPVRDQLRALGGTWDAAAKGWRVPADKADAARRLVSGSARTNVRPSIRRGGLCTRCGDECGGDAYRCEYE